MLQYTFNRLLTADFRAMFLFYRDALGFRPLFGDENEVYAEFDTGAVTLALFRRDIMAEAIGAADRSPSAEAQDAVASIYGVPNVDEAVRELESRGVVFIAPPTDREEWGIRTAHFRDPDGNLIEINAPLARN
jgi:catechol 2,3-dioxygenase-like lactoylglutathione lyase family enzyme